MKIRTIIVDDEPLARSRIVKLLQEHEEIHLIAQCRNGQEAIEVINKKQPELIFLDIQMPDLSGFKVLSMVDLQYKPIIIFATAYDNYALKAFDFHAIDYLLKPFDKDRFAIAIQRAMGQIKLKKSSDFNRKLLNLLDDYQQEHKIYTTKFSIKEGGRLHTVHVDDIYWIESEGNYVLLNLERKNYLYRITMNAIETELDSEFFLRIHRSYLLHTRYIKDIKYLNNNEYRFTLKNDRQLISSRSYKDKIDEVFSHTTLG